VRAIIDWTTSRARMMLVLIALSLTAGGLAYTGLPKEGEPDIEIPALFISVPFPGISAEDSERLIVRPLEDKLQDLDGLKRMTGTAAEGYGGVALEFEFGWDKTQVLADVRDKVSQAEANFPSGAQPYSINEINFSQFPIVNIALSGPVPERTLLRVSRELRTTLEALGAVLEVGLAGDRKEMVEVVIDPLKLEAYDVTANELIQVVVNNNQLIAAGEVSSELGAFSVKIPSSFSGPQDVYGLPVKVNGDQVIRLGDLAEIRLTFEDRKGTSRFNAEPAVTLQVIKRKGFNTIDTVALVRETVEGEIAKWPEDLREAVRVDFANDTSVQVRDMVSQLEGSVLTAVALVMMVVLGALGVRSALLVGFAVPTSFFLAFALFGVMGVTVSNIVMFGLILAVGMLVDSAIVVVEYADKRIKAGDGPMTAYTGAAKRMVWPIVASTATTLCAFLPMLFWPGVPGEFMGMLPTTLIFVLSASLLVALVFLPVVGGVTGRISRLLERITTTLRRLPWLARVPFFVAAAGLLYAGLMTLLNPAWPAQLTGQSLPLPTEGASALVPGAVMFLIGALSVSVTVGALTWQGQRARVRAGHRRTVFGWFMKFLVGNPVMPIVALVGVMVFVGGVFQHYGENNRGVEFFVDTDPEQVIVYVRARGNLSLGEKDALVREVESRVVGIDGIASMFSFAGDGGLNQFNSNSKPRDTIGQIQIEFATWSARERTGRQILAEIEARIGIIPGIETEILELERGPASQKPVVLRLKGDNLDDLVAATTIARERFDATKGLTLVEDTRPLPGIDWQVSVDVERAGRYGANVAAVGAMVQLVTRGLLLDTMRVDTSDEEIDIRVRLPESDRLLSTLETLRVRTPAGLVPLSNFITVSPVPKLAQIDRVDRSRFLDIKAGVAAELRNDAGEPITASERIVELTRWLEADNPFPDGISWEWSGDQEEQDESMQFLAVAFAGALGLMFMILLAQFNSVYNSVLVLTAVVLSISGVLIGMLVMAQPFSVIMTGTGIVALAGIVVNNNIVLIDQFQEYNAKMPRIEAIVRTAEDRIRPVLLTTITTMAGLTPMMLGASVDFFGGGYTIDAPTALWWKQLATAVVFGLGVATFLTLLITPSLLALRHWVEAGAYGSALGLRALFSRRTRGDIGLALRARRAGEPLILWETGEEPAPFMPRPQTAPVRAAE